MATLIQQARSMGCFFFVNATCDRGPMPPCDGRLVRCHLIPRQTLRRTDQYRRLKGNQERADFLYDPRSWVWGCGGGVGLNGHHGMFDMNFALHVPRRCLPAGVEELAVELTIHGVDLTWYLDWKYGPKGERCTAA